MAINLSILKIANTHFINGVATNPIQKTPSFGDLLL